MRLDFGILWDVGLHISAPLVLADDRSLDFDQSEGSSCVFPGMSATLKTNLRQQPELDDPARRHPAGLEANAWGLNAKNSAMPMFSGMDKGVFKGPRAAASSRSTSA
jgi:hypothetical protein